MASSQIHLLISSFKAYLWIAGYSSLQLEPKEPSLVRRWNLDSFNFDLWPGLSNLYKYIHIYLFIFSFNEFVIF